MDLAQLVLFWTHGLSAAAWFGAIFYRTLTVDPKAVSFFPDPSEYERFSIHLAHHMRAMVLAGLLTCGLSGLALAVLRWNPENLVWSGLMMSKVVVWFAAMGLFTYVSYVHWPWRSLAESGEFLAYRRQGHVLAAGMVFLAGLGFALGQACRMSYPNHEGGTQGKLDRSIHHSPSPEHILAKER